MKQSADDSKNASVEPKVYQESEPKPLEENDVDAEDPRAIETAQE